MDDLIVYGKTFVDCLENLDKVLQRCEEKHLVLNWDNGSGRNCARTQGVRTWDRGG